MSNIVIRAEHLSKRYEISSSRQHDTLRDQLAHGFKSLFQRNGRSSAQHDGTLSDHSSRSETFWALKDISFEIKEGEIVGIIGRNGAGKSTLLKILSRITKPTSGRADIYGRVGSLLEVGVGFDQELSGRENIYLNGAILGMGRAEIARKFDEIVAFAEVERFLDTPVKRYSSGMYVRLAFAVAAHLEPEILLVDEVLAVGDTAFQKKCLGRMGDVARSGRTILFVSHSMGAIARLCSRALWLENGRVRSTGTVDNVISEYLDFGVDEHAEATFSEDCVKSPASEYVCLRAVRVRNSDGKIANSLDVRRPFSVEMEYRILRPTANLRLGLRIITQDGTDVLSTRDLDGGEEDRVREPGEYISRCTIPGDFLNYGRYFVSFGADFPRIRGHFAVDNALAFQIEATGGVGGHVSDGQRGVLRLDLPWVIEQISKGVSSRHEDVRLELGR